jgi:phosphate/sulfate permease
VDARFGLGRALSRTPFAVGPLVKGVPQAAARLAIGLGTLSGGWRIIHTVGSTITTLTPVGGCAAETGAAVAIFTATHLGVGAG